MGKSAPKDELIILIAGASGYLGGMITRTLLQKGRQVRMLVRAGLDCSELAAAGAEPAQGDLKDPESLRAACSGAEIVITTANSARRGGADSTESVDLNGNRNLINAARDAGVHHYIFVSAYGADAAHPVPFLAAKGQTEQYLLASGLPYTILAPHVFMDIWIPIVVGSAVQENRPVYLFGPGERKHSFIAAADVAAFAVAAMQNDAALNKKLPLGGPEALSWREIVGICERLLGHAISIREVRPAEVPDLPELIIGLLSGMETGDVVIPMQETARAFGVGQTFARDLIARTFQAR